MCCFHKAFGVASQSGFRESKSGAATSDLVPFWFFCCDLLPDPELRYQNGARITEPASALSGGHCVRGSMGWLPPA